ncbi:MAG TPA: hypothetical protein VHO24_02815 [Opitutaceae bacterium]|nr:hypothetical protein [Opitutaceae bacterium]
MKTKFVLASVFAALSGLAGLTTKASAGTDLHLSINLGTPRPVIVVPGHDHRGYGYNDAPRGYWKEVEVKTWVPARWVVTYDRRGREVRSFLKGHYAVHTDRVWIAYDSRGHGGNYRRG